MAKQNGPVIWEKTIDFLSFYKRCGVGCVRMKSNLTAERWRSDPAFAGSRKSAARMALAAKLASTFYQTIPQQQRSYPHYKQLVGLAQHMLCKGYDIQQLNKVLHFAVSRYLRKLQAADPNRKPVRSPFAATLSLKAKPAFTKLVQPQLTVPQFSAITISKVTWPVIIPPRGSPAAIAGYKQNRNSSGRYQPSQRWHSCSSQPFPMAGLPMPIPAKSATQVPQNVSAKDIRTVFHPQTFSESHKTTASTHLRKTTL